MIHQHQNGDEGQAVLGELDRIHKKKNRKKNLWTCYQHVELLIAFHFPKAVYLPLDTHYFTHHKMTFTCKQWAEAADSEDLC